MRCLAICFVVESMFNVSLPDREVGIQQEKSESLLIMLLLFTRVFLILSANFSCFWLFLFVVRFVK